MHGMPIKKLWGVTIRIHIGPVALVMVLSILAGCSAVGMFGPAAGVRKAPEAGRFSVERLEGDREGFIITEAPQMNAENRRDFEGAVVMMKDGDYDQAIDLLKKVIDQSPGVAAPYINIALACRQAGRREEAEEYLKTALDLFPGHPVVCSEYGLLYRETGRFQEARAMYETVLANFPEYYPVHKNLGILCDLYLNDPACAVEHYEIYSKARPGEKRVKLWIADLHARLESK
jgi:tetratricopeptide (TPR) repeat protein